MSKDFHDQGPRRVGQVKEVTSLANPIIKDIKALTNKKSREESGTFLAEGLKLIIDAIELGWAIRTLVYAKAAKGKPLVEQMAAKTVASGGLVLEVSEKVIASITRRDNPQMVVGIFEQRWTPLKGIRLSDGETCVERTKPLGQSPDHIVESCPLKSGGEIGGCIFWHGNGHWQSARPC